MKLVSWALSDTGLKRQQNEDSFLVSGELGLFAVADGMGGHKGGATASSLALNVLKEAVDSSVGDLAAAAARLKELSLNRWVDSEDEAFDETRQTDEIVGRATTEHTIDLSVTEEDIESVPPATAVMRLAARKASSAVFRAAGRDPSLRGMGTTLTAMLCESGRMHLIHAGDSRAYLLRNGQIDQLTEDHSWIAEQIRAGAMDEEEAKSSQFRHIITRSIGFERDVVVDSTGLVVQTGDCFLLCSDGLSNYVELDELGELMNREWYSRLPRTLVDLANERGGDDNITVVVVYAANEVAAS